jgi:hypothetical protein
MDRDSKNPRMKVWLDAAKIAFEPFRARAGAPDDAVSALVLDLARSFGAGDLRGLAFSVGTLPAIADAVRFAGLGETRAGIMLSGGYFADPEGRVTNTRRSKEGQGSDPKAEDDARIVDAIETGIRFLEAFHRDVLRPLDRLLREGRALEPVAAEAGTRGASYLAALGADPRLAPVLATTATATLALALGPDFIDLGPRILRSALREKCGIRRGPA